VLVNDPAANPPKRIPRKGLRVATGPSAAPVAHLLPTDTRQTDPDLATIIDAWPDLPAAVRAGIVAMVRAAGGK
jgi:hypothetical protein